MTVASRWLERASRAKKNWRFAWFAVCPRPPCMFTSRFYMTFLHLQYRDRKLQQLRIFLLGLFFGRQITKYLVFSTRRCTTNLPTSFPRTFRSHVRVHPSARCAEGHLSRVAAIACRVQRGQNSEGITSAQDWNLQSLGCICGKLFLRACAPEIRDALTTCLGVSSHLGLRNPTKGFPSWEPVVTMSRGTWALIVLHMTLHLRQSPANKRTY